MSVVSSAKMLHFHYDDVRNVFTTQPDALLLCSFTHHCCILCSFLQMCRQTSVCTLYPKFQQCLKVAFLHTATNDLTITYKFYRKALSLCVPDEVRFCVGTKPRKVCRNFFTGNPLQAVSDIFACLFTSCLVGSKTRLSCAVETPKGGQNF